MHYHKNHDAIINTVKALCPWGVVRVANEPLRRPCDYAVVVDGPEGCYTVTAADPAAWREIDGMMASGFDFSAAYERVFDRDWAKLALENEKPNTKRSEALLARVALNIALDAAVDALCHPGA